MFVVVGGWGWWGLGECVAMANKKYFYHLLKTPCISWFFLVFGVSRLLGIFLVCKFFSIIWHILALKSSK